MKNVGYEVKQASDERHNADSQLQQPIVPTQARSRARVEAILEIAEQHIATNGIDNLSLPQLADQLGIPRASVYRYFPSPQLLLQGLAERYLAERERLIPSAWGDTDCWRTGLTRLIRAAAGYYAERPAARAVLLHRGMSPEVASAHKETMDRLASTIRQLFEAHTTLPSLPRDPDPFNIAIEVVTAIFSLSERGYRELTETYVEEARRVAEAYLAQRIADAFGKP